jgi:hypothetical protein
MIIFGIDTSYAELGTHDVFSGNYMKPCPPS